MYLKAPKEDTIIKVPMGMQITLLLTAIFTFILGIYPTPLSI